MPSREQGLAGKERCHLVRSMFSKGDLGFWDWALPGNKGERDQHPTFPPGDSGFNDIT